jgi:hypothetical protein
MNAIPNSESISPSQARATVHAFSSKRDSPACARGTGHVVSLIVFDALLIIYVYSALLEEVWLQYGDHGGSYLTYQQSTGFFLPTRVSKKLP